MLDYKNLPNKPGIYIFKDADSRILYVGKAKSLKNRVSSYFTKTTGDRPWIEFMMPLVRGIETVIVNNETEALMLESVYIKQHQPKFNLRLPDDSSYPYIKYLEHEKISRWSVVRSRSNDKAQYFGPYLAAYNAQSTLEQIRNLFGIHISKKPIKSGNKPCLYCQMYGFDCPINSVVPKNLLLKRDQQAIDFLKGKRSSLIADTETAMNTASAANQFELAAVLRDRLNALKAIRQQTRQDIIIDEKNSYEALGVAGQQGIYAFCLMTFCDGRISNSNNYVFESMSGSDEAIENFITTYYPQIATTSELCLSTTVENPSSIEQFLLKESGRQVILSTPQQGKRKKTLELATINANNALAERLLKTGRSTKSLVALSELLNLDNIPNRIEAVDISNLGTSETVGATVCYKNGSFDKNEYRRYKIKTVEGQNDFAMINEVVTRRFNDTTREVPDLFVVDGGVIQLKFALDALKNTQTKPRQIIALAKKPDRVFVAGRKLPLAATRGHLGVKLLGQIRDETHRFVISFQRARQRKKSLRV